MGESGLRAVYRPRVCSAAGDAPSPGTHTAVPFPWLKVFCCDSENQNVNMRKGVLDSTPPIVSPTNLRTCPKWCLK